MPYIQNTPSVQEVKKKIEGVENRERLEAFKYRLEAIGSAFEPSIESLKCCTGLQRSDCRLVVSGDVIKFVQYFDEEGKPWFYNYGASLPGNKDDREWINRLCIPEDVLDDTEVDVPTDIKKSLTEDERNKKRRRCRRVVTELINTNYLTEFLTLTFALDENTANFQRKVLSVEGQRDRQRVWKSWDYFKRSFQRKFWKFPYVAILEEHDSGRTSERKRGTHHVHVACKTLVGSVSGEEIQHLWGYGMIKLLPFENGDNPGAYMSKYLTKSVEGWNLNERSYTCSQGLKRPKRIRDRLHAEYVIDILPKECVVYDENVTFADSIMYFRSGGQMNPSSARVTVWNLTQLSNN